MRRYCSLKPKAIYIEISLQSKLTFEWKNEVSWLIILTNRSPPSSMEGKFTRDGLTNSLSRRAVTRCSKTRCIQNNNIKLQIQFLRMRQMKLPIQSHNTQWGSFYSTWTKIDITSLGEGNTAVIVAASLRTVSATNYLSLLILARKKTLH